MRISYRTHPALRYVDVDSPSFCVASVDGDDKENIYETFDSAWKGNRLLFKNSVYTISKTFLNSMYDASPKLLKLELLQEIGAESGTLIIGKMVIFYHIQIEVVDGKEFSVFYISVFVDEICYGYYIPAMPVLGRNLVFLSKLNLMHDSAHKDSFFSRYTRVVIIFLLFKKYAQVETKLLPPGKKVKDIHCNHKNDTKLPVTVLDSTWFTNLVKSDGFKVRGHFRLQPKKHNGKWTKDLIWINDFEKSGYTAPARKLKEE
jgi:hypothetical protein